MKVLVLLLAVLIGFLDTYGQTGQGFTASDTVNYWQSEKRNVSRFRKTEVFTEPSVDIKETAVKKVVKKAPQIPYNVIDVFMNPIYVIGPQVSALYKKYIEYNSSLNARVGYRVQLYSGPSREEANDGRLKFMDKYADIEAYQLFEKPFYKVRVGDFIRQQDAELLAEQIKKLFPNAIVVRDNIELPKRRKEKEKGND